MTEVIEQDGIETGIEELTDADLARSLPCQGRHFYLWQVNQAWRFLHGRPYRDHMCGKPSVARLRVSCGNCGARYHLFLCKSCAGMFRKGKVICRVCLRGRRKCRGTES
jgi:hypothetical protein